MTLSIDAAMPGKVPAGKTEIPFEFPLKPRSGRSLYETYHGVFVNIQYLLKTELKRSFLNKDLTKAQEFIVEYKVHWNNFLSEFTLNFYGLYRSYLFLSGSGKFAWFDKSKTRTCQL